MHEEYKHLSASDRAQMLPAKKTQHQLQVGPSLYKKIYDCGCCLSLIIQIAIACTQRFLCGAKWTTRARSAIVSKQTSVSKCRLLDAGGCPWLDSQHGTLP